MRVWPLEVLVDVRLSLEVLGLTEAASSSGGAAGCWAQTAVACRAAKAMAARQAPRRAALRITPR